MFSNISDEIKQQAQQIVDEYAKNISKKAVNDFVEFLISQMKERDYMGIKYKQGTFSDRDIEYFANEFIVKQFGVEIKEYKDENN